MILKFSIMIFNFCFVKNICNSHNNPLKKQGWNSVDTVVEAERLALTLQSTGNLEEAQELLER